MSEPKQIFDISPLISARLAVFPGDQAFQRDVALSIDRGDHLTLSSIRTTLHIGAHADAPCHYGQGVGIGERPLQPYIGPCQVVRATAKPGSRIGLKDLSVRGPWTCPRILVATGSFPNPNSWNSDFCSFEPELLEQWGQAGVRLVGIDTPSIDPESSKALESHQVIHRYDMSVLEGLVLDHVPDGMYFLSALPIKISEADAAPVRAALIQY